MSDPALRDAFQVLERAERAAQATLADRFQAIKQALTAVWGAEAVRGIIPLRPNCPRMRVFIGSDQSLLLELDGPAGVATVALIRHGHWDTWGPETFDLAETEAP